MLSIPDVLFGMCVGAFLVFMVWLAQSGPLMRELVALRKHALRAAAPDGPAATVVFLDDLGEISPTRPKDRPGKPRTIKTYHIVSGPEGDLKLMPAD